MGDVTGGEVSYRSGLCIAVRSACCVHWRTRSTCTTTCVLAKLKLLCTVLEVFACNQSGNHPSHTLLDPHHHAHAHACIAGASALALSETRHPSIAAMQKQVLTLEEIREQAAQKARSNEETATAYWKTAEDHMQTAARLKSSAVLWNTINVAATFYHTGELPAGASVLRGGGGAVWDITQGMPTDCTRPSRHNLVLVLLLAQVMHATLWRSLHTPA